MLLKDQRFQIVAVFLCLLAVVLLGGHNTMGIGVFNEQATWADSGLLLAAIVCMLLAVLLGGAAMARAGLEPPTDRSRRWPEWLGLAGVLLLAAGVRLYKLGDIPRWLDYDTAQNGWIALTLLEQLPEKGFQPVLIDWATGNEAAYLYIVGFCLDLFGVSLEALRLPNSLMGILTVLVIYLLGRELFGPAVGLAAGFLAAIVPWHLELSRMATRPSFTALFVGIGLLLLARTLRARTTRARWGWLVACGVSLGVGLHGYEAFRIFPLAAAAALVWLRLRQKRLGRGVAELAVMAGCATVMTLPVILFAFSHPEVYMEHVSNNSIFSAVEESGSLAPLLKNATDTLGFFLFALPSAPARSPLHAAPLLLVTPLFLSGLIGLLLLIRRDGEDHRRARVLLLCTLVFMTAPFMLARFSLYAPRRYAGEMVPFYLLAGAAAVGLLRTVRDRLGRAGPPAAWLLGVVAAAALISTVPTAYDGLNEILPQYRYPRADRALRWAMERAQTHHVYMTPNLAGSSYLTRFFLKHPRLNYLPTAWPLPDGPADRDMLLVGHGEPWWDGLVRHLGATREVVTLDMPGKRPPVRLVAYTVPRRELLNKRLAASSKQPVARARLLVSRPGLYRLRHRGGEAGKLMVGGETLELPAEGTSLEINLSSGLHEVEVGNPGGLARLEWRLPGSEEWTATPTNRMWRLPAGAFPAAPEVLVSDLKLHMLGEYKIQEDGSFQHLRELQDVIPDGDGYLVLDLDHHPLKRWKPGAPLSYAPVLLDAGGEPYVNPDSYEQDPHKKASLALGRGVTFLLRRWDKKVLRFGPHGRLLGEARIEPTAPIDIAFAGNTLLVADPGARIITAVEKNGRDAPRTLVSDVLVVDIAARGERIAYLDQLRHQLVTRTLVDPELGERVHLGHVNDRMRISLSPDGTILVIDPVRKLQLLFNRVGQVLAPHGDLRWLAHVLQDRNPLKTITAGYFHSGRKEVVLCVQPDVIVHLGGEE